MGIENAKTGHLIYHLTKVDNFDSIVRNGLLPRREIMNRRLSFDNIANMEIINKRSRLGLDMYTPFHFHPYSAFDVVVKSTYGAHRMMYMCIDRAIARSNGFKILPKHPLSDEECVLYDYDEGFNLIDWDTLQKKNLYTDYAKEVKMAECLTDNILPIDFFSQLYVPTEEIKAERNDVLEKQNIADYIRPNINVLPIWFNY